MQSFNSSFKQSYFGKPNPHPNPTPSQPHTYVFYWMFITVLWICLFKPLAIRCHPNLGCIKTNYIVSEFVPWIWIKKYDQHSIIFYFLCPTITLKVEKNWYMNIQIKWLISNLVLILFLNMSNLDCVVSLTSPGSQISPHSNTTKDFLIHGAHNHLVDRIDKVYVCRSLKCKKTNQRHICHILHLD